MAKDKIPEGFRTWCRNASVGALARRMIELDNYNQATANLDEQGRVAIVRECVRRKLVNLEWPVTVDDLASMRALLPALIEELEERVGFPR